jgi:serine/threonine protein kinase
MGVVWQAVDERLEREVALKFLANDLALSPDALARLRREANVLLDLTHPGILRVHTLEQEGDLAFLVMEFISGGSLADLMADRSRMGPTGVDAGEALWLLSEIAPALDLAHREGVVHADLKPSNLMLTRRPGARLGDGGERVKLTDFGIACAASRTVFEGRGAAVAGTPAYMAPELLRGGPPTVATDIYALGATIHHLLHGALPAVRVGGGPESGGGVLDRAVARALAGDPAARPRSATELLRMARDEVPRDRKTASTRAGSLVAAGVTLAACGSAWGLWVAQRGDDPEHAPRERAGQRIAASKGIPELPHGPPSVTRTEEGDLASRGPTTPPVRSDAERSPNDRAERVPPRQPWDRLEALDNPLAPFSARIWTDSESLRIGQKLSLHVECSANAFIVVVSRSTSGRMHVLLPNALDRENYVAAGTRLVVPGSRSEFDLVVSGPPGEERFKLLATRSDALAPMLERVMAESANPGESAALLDSWTRLLDAVDALGEDQWAAAEWIIRIVK